MTVSQTDYTVVHEEKQGAKAPGNKQLTAQKRDKPASSAYPPSGRGASQQRTMG